jgi:hypothetical protein
VLDVKDPMGPLNDLGYSDFVLSVDAIVTNPTAEDMSRLEEALTNKTGDTYADHEYPRYASRAALGMGTEGVAMLVRLFPHAPGHIYPLAILRAIYNASRGRLPPLLGILRTQAEPLEAAVSAEVRALAQLAFVDAVLQAQEDPGVMSVLSALLQEQTYMSDARGNDLGVELLHEIAADVHVQRRGVRRVS